jgi:hypothetical protein
VSARALSLLADLVLTGHVAFVLFVVFGGLLALRWPRAAWVHVPCAFWGALVEVAGWVCPLTPLEVALRRAAGEGGYSGGFLAHYVEPLLYPPGLTRGMQVGLGLAVIALNLGVYAVVWRRRRRSEPTESPPGG